VKRLHAHSQYFLRNPRFVGKLIDASNITKSDTVLDIGAGTGIISSQLATRVKHVIAVEPELRTARKLRENMAQYDNVEVIENDALEIVLPMGKYKIFANIPFHISAKIVRNFSEESHPPETMYLVVQKQFAHKLLPRHNGFSSQLGMQIGVLYDIAIEKRLLRTDYWPHPNVDTVLVCLKRREIPLIPRQDYDEYKAYVEKCFLKPDYFARQYKKRFDELPQKNASGLYLEDWVRLFS
jgi:16S rRNA A1518/A1519 N6-dimethyltransferase RsmA/KsgA/DIM1 with predicted DNA glycosylase/AP lyase activity